MATKVLIVDDEALLLRTLSAAFGEAGYEVTVARTAEEAMKLCASRRLPFDLVILDNRLPGRSGLDFLEEIEDREQARIILMTAFDTAETQARSHRLGVNRYLKKPFDLKVILDEAKQLVNRNRSSD